MNYTGKSLNQYTELLANNQHFADFRKISGGFPIGRDVVTDRKMEAGLPSHFTFTMRLYTLNRVPSMVPETRVYPGSDPQSANASNVLNGRDAPKWLQEKFFTLRSRKTLNMGLWTVDRGLWTRSLAKEIFFNPT